MYDIIGAVMSNKSSESDMGNVKSGSQVAGSATGGQNETLTAEELRKRRQAYFDRYVLLLTWLGGGHNKNCFVNLMRFSRWCKCVPHYIKTIS